MRVCRPKPAAHTGAFPMDMGKRNYQQSSRPPSPHRLHVVAKPGAQFHQRHRSSTTAQQTASPMPPAGNSPVTQAAPPRRRLWPQTKLLPLGCFGAVSG